VFGARFRPGGFRPFLGAPVSSATGRFVPFETMDDDGVADAILAAGDAGAVTIMDRFLASFGARRDADADLVAAVVDRAATDPAVARVEQLAADLGYSDQAHLTRDFSTLVGYSLSRHARAQ
jgi:hypothetical protein